VRRSSRATSAIVAEAWSRRDYPAAFSYKLVEAMGEAMETQVGLDHARFCGYLSQEEYEVMDDAWQHIGAMLQRMRQRANRFCTST
jgi:four helix bundle protein